MIKVQILKQTEPFIANDINSEIANTMSWEEIELETNIIIKTDKNRVHNPILDICFVLFNSVIRTKDGDKIWFKTESKALCSLKLTLNNSPILYWMKGLGWY